MRRHQFVAAVLIAVVVVAPRSLAAQVIRGTVTDVAGAPAAGAVVTLVRPAAHDTLPGTDLRSVLADVTGAYSIATPGPGSYRIIVRRIGSRPYRSEVLVMAAGETRRVDVRLEGILLSVVTTALPEIRVTRATPCRTDVSDAVRIATLWNDARTALLAAEAARRDRTVPTLLIRYVRDLNPQNLSTESEELQVFDHHDAGNTLGFRSLSGDSLSLVGYWERSGGATTTFYGPDANALLSEAFVRDHCFNLVDASTESPDAVGLFFQPVRGRTRPNAPPEIRGAVWFDRATSRLQRVEFNWIVLPGNASISRLGGELAFAWNAIGVVHVDRWRLRMPQDIYETLIRGTRSIRVRRLGIVEEGGVVFADSAALGAGTATLRGDLRIERRPLGGAQVRVLGTDLATVTDEQGRFVLRDVPAGLRVLVADHPSTASFGLRTAVLRVLLDAGENRNVSLIAPDQEKIATTLCGENALAGGRALLRVTVMDSATARPASGLRVRLFGHGGPRPVEAEHETDASGAALFCGLPSNQLLVVTGPGGAILLSDFTLTKGELASRQLWVQR
jgi:hypothetical protein